MFGRRVSLFGKSAPVALIVLALAGTAVAAAVAYYSIGGKVTVTERTPVVAEPERYVVSLAQGEETWQGVTVINRSDLDQSIELETVITPIGEGLTPEELTVTYSREWIPLPDEDGDGMPELNLGPNEEALIEVTIAASWAAAPGSYSVKTNLWAAEVVVYAPPEHGEFVIGDFEDNSYDYWTAGDALVGEPVNSHASLGEWSFAYLYEPGGAWPADGERMVLHVSAEEGPMADNDDLVNIYLRNFEVAQTLHVDVTLDNTEWDLGESGWVNLLEAVVIQNDASSWQQINIPENLKAWNGESGTFSFDIDLSGIEHAPEGDTWTKLVLIPMYGDVVTAGNFYFDNIVLIW